MTSNNHYFVTILCFDFYSFAGYLKKKKTCYLLIFYIKKFKFVNLLHKTILVSLPDLKVRLSAIEQFPFNC